ncbi:alpha/beta hydrolase [Paraburkholderia fungorum]|uniref:BD-FAE-like domain-containing protein n=1 Tax=Paraburkholderia fungorum TaxID=134537 RepID=A0A420GJZ0_9BURK|nr:alpha/beta hydrolase [Paraburkholderia fungorum]RKF45421.1 hypothetical protein BCY88_27280 [Paraburkholderia fungorum]
MSWRSLDASALEIGYSPSSCTGGDYSAFIAEYRSGSERAYATLHCERNLPYGSAPAERLDFFPASQANAPLVVYIHGGYWQELSKDESCFAANGFIEQGAAFCSIDYTLAPHASVHEMVRQCVTAIEWLHARHAMLGFDPNRVVVAGSSAGAHLAAMATLRLGSAAQTRRLIKGAVLLSGIFELEPLVQTSINQAVGLTRNDAIDLSPVYFPLADFPSAVVAWGGIETAQFKWQSQRFADLLRERDRQVTCIEVGHRNHFDIALDLGDRTTGLGQAVRALVDSTQGF